MVEIHIFVALECRDRAIFLHFRQFILVQKASKGSDDDQRAEMMEVN